MNYREASKYPRTRHFDFSESVQNDDSVIESLAVFHGQRVILTEKMDGENITIYNNYSHPRSVIDDGHPSRDYIKGMIAKFQYLIPEDMRICGENMFAKHSVEYDNLKTYFYAFNMWVKTSESDECISWDEFILWCEEFKIMHVPVLYDGIFDYDKIKSIYKNLDFNKCEGVVCRLASSFLRDDFGISVAKAVRPNHVQTDEHWKNNWTKNIINGK